MAPPVPPRTDPTIIELLVRLDQYLRDLEDDCSAAEKWVTDHRTSDRSVLVDELDGLKWSIKSEVSLLAMFVQRLETEDTRSRIVPAWDASTCDCSHGPAEHASWCKSQVTS